MVNINIVLFQLGDQLYKRQNLPNNEMYRTLILLRKKGMCRKLFRGSNQTQMLFSKKIANIIFFGPRIFCMFLFHCKYTERRVRDSHQSQDSMLFQCWPTVYDAGSTLIQHSSQSSCLPGCSAIYKHDIIHCHVLLTLSSLNLPFSSSSTTSRELLSQFSTCSG